MATASHGANLGFESDLWRAADALRSNMDAAEYKHVVLGLIFLKYISDAFEEQHAQLAIERDNPSLKGVLPKDYAHQRLDKHRLPKPTAATRPTSPSSARSPTPRRGDWRT